MADATPNLIGQDLGAGADDALFEQLFMNELHAAFLEANVMRSRTMVKSISHGKSATFDRTWKADAQYHTAGTELLGTNNIQHTQKTILVDDRVSSDIFVNEIDELKNHYSVRSEYARQMGFALSKVLDINIIRTIALAARATPDFGAADVTTPTDRTITSATIGTDADVLKDAFYTIAQKFDEGNVPSDERCVVLGPAQYYLLFQTTDNFLLNRDWAGGGSIQNASVPSFMGLDVVRSNHMTAAALGNNYAGVAGENNTYAGNYTNTVAVAFHKSAVGTVLLKDLALKVVDQPEKYGTLLLGSYIAGTSDLRPESAIELTSA